MGCNIPRPWKRPPTPPIYEPPEMPKTAPVKKEIMEQAINEPLTSLDRIRKGLGLDPISDQPYGSKTNEAILKAFDQFHETAQDLTYHDTSLDQKIKECRTNCPNCCATITGPICEYCGTRFPELEERHYQIIRTTENQKIIIPIYVGGDQIGEVVKQNRTQFRSGNPAADVVAPTLPIQKQR